MKIFILAILAMTAQVCFADYPVPSEVEFILNHSGSSAVKTQLGTQIVSKKSQLLKATYDFSTQGGAIGTIQLTDVDGKPAVLPAKAIIKRVFFDVITTFTSGGSATVAVSSGQSAGDLKAAAAFGGYTGLLDGIPVGTAATSIKLTAKRTPTLTIAVAALTAGKANVFIDYVLSN